MGNITINNQGWGTATYVPNAFIDNYMTEANGEYVKIYLYLLRYMSQPDGALSIGRIADHFDHTEKDVQRALAYWEKMQLLKLEYNQEQTLSGICFLTGQESSSPALPRNNRAKTAAKKQHPADAKPPSATEIRGANIPEKKTPTRDELKALCKRDEVQELVFVAESYLGRTMSRSDLEYIFCWHDQLQFAPELIEFLIETTIAKGHPSFHYMHKIAEDWYAKGITTVAQAREQSDKNNEIYYAVLKGFGIRGRNLIPAEMDMLKKWSTVYGFDKDMILEACTRTIQNIHEPKFEYADSILTKWHAAGCRSMADVAKADATRAQEQAKERLSGAARLSAAKAGTAKTKQTKANGFHDFNQREYDYDQLSQQLLEKSMG